MINEANSIETTALSATDPGTFLRAMKRVTQQMWTPNEAPWRYSRKPLSILSLNKYI